LHSLELRKQAEAHDHAGEVQRVVRLVHRGVSRWISVRGEKDHKNISNSYSFMVCFPSPAHSGHPQPHLPAGGL